MKKIPTLFVRDEQNRSRVIDQITPGCEWAAEGEGLATRKLDGTCCMVEDGAFWKRRELRPDDQPPSYFKYAEHDKTTGKMVGWVPVLIDDPTNRWHLEAFKALAETGGGFIADGTYELVGPKIQGNPEHYQQHTLVRHGSTCNGRMGEIEVADRSFDGLRAFLVPLDIEGLVFHHPDGRMAKIKKRDFGLKRAVGA